MEIEEDNICPISLCPIEIYGMTVFGSVYEYDEIVKWLSKFHETPFIKRYNIKRNSVVIIKIHERISYYI